MAGGKSSCDICGKDISMSGSQMCPVCDPDIMAIIGRKVEKKSPSLCDQCFLKHKESHEAGTEAPAEKHCLNCGNNLHGSDICQQCGGSPRIG